MIPRTAILAVWLGALAACSATTDTFSSATPLRAGTDLPNRFEPPDTLSRVAPADTTPGSGCLSPMRDPRDRTLLRMVRSDATRADYEVPDGRYGVGPTELLRLECNTGRPLGVVRR